MKFLIRSIIILLAFVSCTQLLGNYYPQYFLLDELLLFALLILLLLQKDVYVNKVRLVIALFTLLCFFANIVINFYSFSASFIKISYYIKSILPFLLLPYFSIKYLNKRQLRAIYNMMFLFALFSIIEFYILQYKSIWTFGHDWPFKLRNGLYRAMAFTGHPISLGILDFMGVIIGNEIFKVKKRYLLVFVVSLFLTGSRIPLLFLMIYILYCMRNLKIKLIFYRYFYFKRLYVLSIPLSFLLIIFVPIYFKSVNEGTTTRLIAMEKGISIFKNPVNLFFGTGIGSFGTYESIIYESKVYEKIDFPEDYRKIIVANKATGVETFLFMSLIEMGIIGFILYYFLILNLFQNKISEFKLFIIIVVMLYTLVYPLYTFPFPFILNMFFPNLKQKEMG